MKSLKNVAKNECPLKMCCVYRWSITLTHGLSILLKSECLYLFISILWIRSVAAWHIVTKCGSLVYSDIVTLICQKFFFKCFFIQKRKQEFLTPLRRTKLCGLKKKLYLEQLIQFFKFWQFLKNKSLFSHNDTFSFMNCG